ncbi:MAG: ion channel [Thermodesulfobacteriota bacterium]
MDDSRCDIRRRFKDFWMGDASLTAFLFLLFVAIFLAPFVDSLPVRLLSSLILMLLMVSGVINMSRLPTVRYLSGMIAGMAITLRLMMHFSPSPALSRWGTFASLSFLAMLTLAILYRVFSDSGPVSVHKVRGAIAAYLLIGITWAFIYGLLDQILPNAFSLPADGGEYSIKRQGTITYFSFITLTTLGYGDITPTHEISRMFAVMEALIGQLYPATLLARLVSLQIAPEGARADLPAGEP